MRVIHATGRRSAVSGGLGSMLVLAMAYVVLAALWVCLVAPVLLVVWLVRLVTRENAPHRQ